MIRGAFGQAFRKVLCICSRSGSGECPYHNIFESVANDGAFRYLRNVEKIPHPYLFEIPFVTKQYYDAGESFGFSIRLFGFAADYALNMIEVVSLMGRRGITKLRAPFRIENVYTGSFESEGKLLYNGMKQQYLSLPAIEYFSYKISHGEIKKMALDLLTPLSLVENGRFQSIPEFSTFITSLVRRTAILAYYAGGISGVPDVTQGEKITVDDVRVAQQDLEWTDTLRYSNHQKTNMKFGGLVGKMIYEGNITVWLPLLMFGELIHAGKRTSFGFGQYRVETIG